jgi:hypothetical protein
LSTWLKQRNCSDLAYLSFAQINDRVASPEELAKSRAILHS